MLVAEGKINEAFFFFIFFEFFPYFTENESLLSENWVHLFFFLFVW